MRCSVNSITLSLFLLVIILPSQARDVKDKGLILYFGFDKENGGEIKDQTGGGHHGDLGKGKINTEKPIQNSGGGRQ